MILLHRHRLIFLKAVKVAGTSFEIALSGFADDPADIITPISPDDEQTRTSLGFRGPQNHLDRSAPVGSRRKFYSHIPAAEAKRLLPPLVWDSFTRISIVRNPWDRLVSGFYFSATRRGAIPDLATFTDHFREAPERLTVNHRHYMIDGAEVIDRFLRYERLEEDVLALEAAIPTLSGLWDIFRQQTAKAAIRDRRLSTAEIFRAHPLIDRLVQEQNRWDIERFGYSLPRD